MAKPRPIENLRESLPDYVTKWFSGRGWQPHRYQKAMVEAFVNRRSTLLIAPTGGGKTLSGFLPSLIDCHEIRSEGVHTLYVSPLKALANDIERNLMRPIAEMGLGVTVESRTGDTPQAKRARQRRSPPNIFLTTPESLMLMLSSPDAGRLFQELRVVIVDEVHSFAATQARRLHGAGAVAPVGSGAASHPHRSIRHRRRSLRPRSMARSRRKASPFAAFGPPDEARHSHPEACRNHALWRLHGAIRRSGNLQCDPRCWILDCLRQYARASGTYASDAVGRE